MKIILTEDQFRRIILEDEDKNNIIKNPITTLYHGTSNHKDLSMSTLKIKRDTSMYHDYDSLPRSGSQYEKCHGIYLTRNAPEQGISVRGSSTMYAVWKWSDSVWLRIQGDFPKEEAFTDPKAIIYKVKLKPDVKLGHGFDPCANQEKLDGEYEGLDGLQGINSANAYETIIWNKDAIESISIARVGQFVFDEGGLRKIRYENNSWFKSETIYRMGVGKPRGKEEGIGKIVWS